MSICVVCHASYTPRGKGQRVCGLRCGSVLALREQKRRLAEEKAKRVGHVKDPSKIEGWKKRREKRMNPDPTWRETRAIKKGKLEKMN